MTITIWNTGRLATDLAQRQVSSEEKFLYLLTESAILAGGGYVGSLYISVPEGWLFWYEALLVMVVTVFGCIRCREKYQAATDDRLLENFVILSVPLNVKATLATCMAYVSIGWGLNWLIPHLSLTSESSATQITFFLNAVIKFYPFLIPVITILSGIGVWAYI